MLLSFVDTKAAQLSFYLRGFWQNNIPHSELEIFFWDTMEEWTLVNYDLDQPYTQLERVFWHALHQIHFWSEEKLRADPYLIEELTDCLTFIEGKGRCPLECVGVRP